MSSMDWIMAQQKTEASSQCVVKTTHWNYTPVYTVNCQHHRQFQLTPKTTASTLNEINTQLTGHGIQSSPEKNRRDQRNQSRNPIVTQTPKKEKERSKKPFTQKLSPTREKQSAPDFVRNLNEIAVKYRDWVFRNTIPQNQESQRPPSSSSEKYFLTPRRVRCTLPVIESKIL